MSQMVNLTGERFGRLKVVERAENIGPHTAFLCACDCGASVRVRSQSLRKGETRSCGCLRSDVMREKQHRHGMHGSRTYNSWVSMIARCTNPKHRQWRDYGGRGIAVCEAWRLSFDKFLADMGERPQGKSIDRINNDGNYEPGNCRWADRVEQRRNRRPTAKGNHE